MDYTTNLNLKKPNGEVDGDFADIADINENMEIIDGAVGDHIANANLHVTAEKQAAWDNLKTFQTAGGTATAITLTGIELVDGFQTTFVVLASNSGAATTINAKPLYKPGTTTAPKLVAGKAATVWYNLAGDCFFIKASAEGTAVAGDVLAGKTFSNDDDTGIAGVLSLIGTAGAGDVVSGKTFYNIDAKTIITGSRISKKFASGVVTSSADYTTNFYFSNGTTLALANITVSGLDFVPSTILAFAQNGEIYTPVTVMFPETMNRPPSAGCRIMTTIGPNNVNQVSSSVRAFKLDGVQAYVSASGFRLPCEYVSTIMRWIAFE